VLQKLTESKLNEKRIGVAIEAMVDAMMTVPGITVPEMCSAALRAAHRTAKQGLEMSADGARLHNEEIFRQALHDMLLDLVDVRSAVQ
jgi:hypothetical protein